MRIAVLALLGVLAALPARAELDAKRWKESAEKLEAAIAEGNEKEVGRRIQEIAADDSERAAKLFVKALAKMPESLDLFRAVDPFVSALKNEKGLKLLQGEAAGAKDWRVRSLLFDALGRRGVLGEALVLKALGDKQEEVALAAVREIARAKTAAGVAALCDFMATKEAKGGLRGVVWQAAKNALVRILGVDREGGQDFKNYFEDHKKDFVEGKGIPAAGAAEGRRDKEGGQTVAIFGQEIHCKSVVLILDVSGSMDIPDQPPPDQRTVLRKPDKSEEDEWRRITRAKKEFKRVLEGLAKGKAKVNVITFSTDVEAWKPEGLFDLTDSNLKSASSFVDKFKADGVTCTDSALEWAFQHAPQADCFYLISDGYATHDGTAKVPTKRILDEVAEMNRLRHVQINTLGFVSPFPDAPSADPELMQALADATGGTYSEVK
jgi:hypothetical protein